jgi:microcystin-dependent protein
MTATLRSPFNLSAHLRPTVGDQKITFAGTDHMGWMLCNGRGLDTTRFALLFNVIGYTFGGSGNTFNLPDYRGCVPGMAGQPSFNQTVNNASYAIGNTTGEQRHTLNIDEMPKHTHGPTDATRNNNGTGFTDISGAHTHTGTTSDQAYSGTSSGATSAVTGISLSFADDTGTHRHTLTIDVSGAHAHAIGNTGGDQPHNNMQPTLFGGNMFIYSGRTMDAYFPYTWVGGVPAPDGTAPNPNVITIY